jgi:hypothetical protein
MHLEKHYLHIMKVKISSFVGHKIKEEHDSRPKLCVEHQRQKTPSCLSCQQCVCMCVRSVTHVLLYLSSFGNVIMHLFQVSIVEE